MKLKQLQVQGFKSFVDRTVLNFTDNITCVVGPNGCGKSNIVDAIRWVLGEQSSKQLRGGAMEDVIFHGTDDMHATGMAEVTLVFDNSDKRCPPEYAGFTEIQVTRRLFRSGESEYYINRAACRLKDITDLFLGSGVGSKAYSIVEQGAIDKIITMKPEQRRVLIEEAAGVSKYRVRRLEATRKMEATRNNLVRIRDIIAELKRQMNSLNRQAKKAERYKKYRDSLKDTELELAAYKALRISSRRAEMAEKDEAIKARSAEIAVQLETVEAELEERKTELVDIERELSNWRDRGVEASREVEKHDRALAMIEQERKGLERTLDRIGGEARELKDRMNSVEAEIEGLVGDDAGLREKIARAEEELKAAVESRNTKDREYRELLEATSVLEKHAMSLAAGVDKLGERVAWSEKRRSELESRGESLAGRKKNLEDALEEQAKANISHNEKLHRARKEADELREIVAVKENELAENRTALAVALDRHKEITAKFNRSSSRLQSLREMERNFEGYERGVKAIMERKEELAAQGKNGTYGLIAEVVKTDPQYETALEAVLGERLQTIFVRSREHGLDNIHYLRANGKGRSSFMPLETAAEASYQVPPQLAQMGAALLADQVEASGEFAPVVKAMIGEALVVDDIAQAAAVRESIGAANPLVTREGVLIDRMGVMAGGSADSFAGVLAKKREIEELEEKVDRLESEQKRAEAEHNDIERAIAENREELSDLKERLHRLDIERNNLEKDLRQGTNSYNNTRNELAGLEDELGSIEQATQDLAREAEEARAKIDADTRGRERIEADLAERQEVLATLRAEREAENQRRTAAQVNVAAMREKLDALANHKERLHRALDEIARGIEKRQADDQAARERLDGLSEQKSLAEKAKEEASIQAREIEEKASAERARHGEKAQALREMENETRGVRRERDELRSEGMDVELALSQLQVQWENLEENVMDRFGMELPAVTGGHGGRIADEDARDKKRDEREELRRKIERMGDVNPTAIEEFNEISERHSFLSNQEADLINALENLELTIGKINNAYKKSFKQTFEKVNENFQQIFPRLFNGGQAVLSLTNPEDILESGIDIMAQPPGKKMKSIVLLSGGEKALTSSGLIVSLFLVKPSPFCLLDEVDAALDDMNVTRFNDLIMDLADHSQLIVITHNKRTMEMAETLYGVTMEKKGVSKIVSVRFKGSTVPEGESFVEEQIPEPEPGAVDEARRDP